VLVQGKKDTKANARDVSAPVVRRKDNLAVWLRQDHMGSPVSYWASQQIDAERLSLFFSFSFLRQDHICSSEGSLGLGFFLSLWAVAYGHSSGLPP